MQEKADLLTEIDELKEDKDLLTSQVCGKTIFSSIFDVLLNCLELILDSEGH